MSLAYVARDKTISIEPIVEYFEITEKYMAYIKHIEAQEKEANEKLQYGYQTWTHGNVMTHISYSVKRTDGAMVDYKSINDFKNTLLHQPSSVKCVYAHIAFNYGVIKKGHFEGRENRSGYDLTVGVNGFKFEYDINPAETEFVKITDEFVAKIDKMPVKLDRIIKQKEIITMKVGFAMGMIPAIILAFASLFIPQAHDFYHQYFWTFPLALFGVGFILGIFLGGMKLSSAYSKLIPTKYGGYNTKTRSSYRVDDMDTFCEEVDVLIGEKSNVGSTRKFIEQTEKTYKKLILPELGGAVVATIIAFVFTMIGGN